MAVTIFYFFLICKKYEKKCENCKIEKIILRKNSELRYRLCPNTHTCSLCTWPLGHLNDVFGPSVQVRRKTTSVCQTFNYLMGHTNSVVKMQVFAQLYFNFNLYFAF